MEWTRRLIAPVLATTGLMTLLQGCTGKPQEKQNTLEQALQQSLQLATELKQLPTQQLADKIKNTFAQFNAKTATASRSLYAQDAYLNDRIVAIRGRDSIVEYFAEAATKVQEARFDFHDFTFGEKDLYTRWTMVVRSETLGEGDYRFEGMSQMRFNQQGEVIFHLDFWDYSELLEAVPMLGWVVGKTKG